MRRLRGNLFSRMSEPIFIAGKKHVPTVISAITSYLIGTNVRSVHYVGYADEGLIREMIRIPGLKLSLMDYWDRYHRGAHFCNDDDTDLSDLEVPAWLDGVLTYFEGFPKCEALIWDMEPCELENCIKSRPPKHLILEGQGIELILPANYEWEKRDTVMFGKRARQPLIRAS